MPSIDSANLATASGVKSLSPQGLNDRLAEAACYAVLRRLMPVLRHGVAGAMQPIRIVLVVLERRVQAPEPDLQAIAKNVTTASGLAKQASIDCISALEWTGSSNDAHVSVRSGVDEAIKLLAMELSANALTLDNGISDDLVTAPQSFLRTVFMGALLAFCDQSAAAGTLQVTLEAATDPHSAGRLQVRLVPDDSGKSRAAPEDMICRYRLIEWPDVEAMARPFGVKVAQGDGWQTLELP